MGSTFAATLTGVVERIIFLNEENHYTIAEFRPDEPGRSSSPPRAVPVQSRIAPAPTGPKERVEPVTIVGPLPGVECGETLHLTGEWTRHAQHGAQFKITAFRSELPASVYGIRKYLGSGLVPGIGKVYANKIVDAFGTDTFRVLSEESARLRDVEGIGRKRANAIKAAWDAKRTERELYIFLQTYGVTPGQCVKIAKHFGPAAQTILTSEPYRAAREIDGIGFKTADRIAINLGFANDAPPRLDAGLIFALETLQEEGHTAFAESDLIDYAANLLETDSKLLAARIDALVEAKQLVRHRADRGDATPLSRHVAGVVDPGPGSTSPATPDGAQSQLYRPRHRDEGVAAPAPGTQNTQLRTQNFESRTQNSKPKTQNSKPGIQNPEPEFQNPEPGTGARSALIQLPHNDRAERKIADVVMRLHRVRSGLPPIRVDAAVEWAEKKAGFAFHELQRRAVRHALTAKFSILTGGPGTGKTTILRALVEILKAKKVRVHLAAPTGRAAQRLADTTGGFASTIHRLLKWDPAAGCFVANESTPLATDFLIVDEASMLDTRLASALLQAVPSRAHVLLVGDIDQLPSVGAGNVLKDLIAVARGDANGVAIPASRPTRNDSRSHAAGVAEPGLPAGASGNVGPGSANPATSMPVTRLSVIYRQQDQSGIVTTAHAINAGDPSLPPAVPDVAHVQARSDLTFVVATDAEDCLRKVIELCTEFVPQKLQWPHPVNDVQVLAPMHKGVAGVANFNAQLQTALNPHARGLRAVSGEYRPGDKIIQLRNNYDKNLFNGDIGTVVSVDADRATMIAEFDGTRHPFERGEFGDLALAYAISIHKSQGSEYPVVIVPLLKAHFMMLQRNLIYTAITRGKKKVFLVGEPAAYAMAVRNSESKQRLTHLREKILAAAPADRPFR